MKRVIFLSLGVIWLISVAAVSYSYIQEVQTDSMIFKNLEALSNDELQPGSPCYVTVTYDCNMPAVADCNQGACRFTNGTHENSSVSKCQ